MKVAISYPPLESDKGVPLLSQNRQFQWFHNPTYIYPMIPAYAATLLKESGYEVIWDDAIAEGKSPERWLRDLEGERPDVVAMETKTPVVKTHWRIIEEIKRIRPGTIVVLMGDHVTALPSESMANSKVDFVITGGDYDFSLLSICKSLESKFAPMLLEPGVWYREDGQIKHTGKFQNHHSIHELPFIDRDLTQWWLYSEKNGNYKKLPGTYTMAGRDCWYHKCTFCSWTTIFPTFRVRSPENLLDEVGMLISRYGIREIMDDTGTFPVGDWLRRFCKGMIERGYSEKVTMDCNMRFGALSFEEYQLMREAGFRFILFGLESASQRTLDRIRKRLTVEKIVESCKSARRAGLSPHVTIMFGYPWETYEEVVSTVALGKELLRRGHAHTLQATMVIPYPGTPLFEECRRNGWLTTLDWGRYDMREPVMVTPIGDKRLMEAVQEVYKVTFDPRFILRRLLFIRDLDDLRFYIRAGRAVMGHLLDFRPRSTERC